MAIRRRIKPRNYVLNRPVFRTSSYAQIRLITVGEVHYRQRRTDRRYIGSAHVEKANDLIVARRQKNRGMQWSEATSDALAALRTLMLNGGWERYWVEGEVLPLASAA